MQIIYLNDLEGKSPQRDFKVKTVPRIGETIEIEEIIGVFEKYKVVNVIHFFCSKDRDLISLQIDVIKL